jgi:hypothetical protein
MKSIFNSMLLVVCSIVMLTSIEASAQTPRSVISSGAGLYSTVGQPIIGFSKGTPNMLWQGFWVPKNVVSSVVMDFNPIVTTSKVFPNPAAANITIEASKPILNVYLFDANGNNVKYFSGNTSSVNELANGIYSMRIKFTDNTVENHRLIIYR